MILPNTDHTGSGGLLERNSGGVPTMHLAVQFQGAIKGPRVRVIAPKGMKTLYFIGKDFQVIVMDKCHITIGCLLFYHVRTGRARKTMMNVYYSGKLTSAIYLSRV